MPIDLQTSIRYLKGVGEQRAALYGKLGIETMEDLLYHIPRNYTDLIHPLTIIEAYQQMEESGKEEMLCAIRAKLTHKEEKYFFSSVHYRGIRYSLVASDKIRGIFMDKSFDLKMTLFNTSYLYHSLNIDEDYIFYGKIRFYASNTISMTSPQIFPVGEMGTLQPVYPLTEGLSNKMVISHLREALTRLKEIPDPLGEMLPRRYDLLPYERAVRAVHFPTGWEQVQAGRNRMVFDELLSLTLCFARLRQGRAENHIPPMQMQPLTDFYNALSYELTGAQQRTIAEALSDMCSGVPMNRLVQGDVGSGKTAVAAACCYFAYLNGYQSALMAPTEILAQQHEKNLAPLLERLGMRVALLTGSVSPKKKAALKAQLAAGEIDLCIGTHALLTADTAFTRLGLVVTDEQHRFGVNQRTALRQKGLDTHVLVMSATPIPRTLAMIVYGDLDISVIDELPAGRSPIKTYLIDSSIRERAFGYIRKHLDAGYQGYIICPAVQNEEDPDDTGLKSAVKYAEELADGAFSQYRVGLLHGKMPAAQKEKVMQDFVSGEIELLIATTVVEVGVDVPNAVIMMVENAERFGLSQLHQLRGRVGRGDVQSCCILLSDSKNPEAQERLRVLRATNDGFQIAEEDLKQRGPGDFFGERQHGLPELKAADLAADARLLQKAREAADDLTAHDPKLRAFPALARRVDRMMEKMSL